MSKKKVVKKQIKKGKYYYHKDSSAEGHHPSYVYKKRDNKNEYYLVCFTRSKGKHRTKLNKNINPRSTKPCYVLRSPTIAKRGAMENELRGYKVTDKRDKAVIKSIQKKK